MSFISTPKQHSSNIYVTWKWWKVYPRKNYYMNLLLEHLNKGNFICHEFFFNSYVYKKKLGYIQKSDKSLKLYCYNIEVSQHEWAKVHTHTHLLHSSQMNVLIKDDGERQWRCTAVIMCGGWKTNFNNNEIQAMLPSSSSTLLLLQRCKEITLKIMQVVFCPS